MILSILCLTFPHASHAFYGTGLEQRVGTVYCDIFDALQGTTAAGMATLAVIFLGIAAMYGKADKTMVVIVVAGIAVIFGAVVIVDFIGGSALPWTDSMEVGGIDLTTTEGSCEAARKTAAGTDIGTAASMLGNFIDANK